MNFSEEQERRIAARLVKEFESWLKDRQVEPHYSAGHVAELLDVTERTVWNWVDEGERTSGAKGIWPVIKLSHKVVRIPASAVNRLLQSRSAALPAKEEHAA